MDHGTCLTTHANFDDRLPMLKESVQQQIKKISTRLKSYGIHSCMILESAGFQYTGDGDTALCELCKLEVSDWIQDMDPFEVHAQRSPNCPFVRSRLQVSDLELDEQENPAKRRKMESNFNQCTGKYNFNEVKILQEIRRRTFSHWPHRSKLTAEQMILAGFFSCNVGDRVICLYCNLICQQWAPDTDDPSEVHKTLSPKCTYVLSMLIQPKLSSAVILNEVSTNNLNNPNQLRLEPLVYTTPCHPTYSDITKRLESFRTWNYEPSPSIDDLVKAGFFYAGTGSVVTCFYCSGSLQNWGSNDNPVTEHARWFSNCAYAKQLCGDELYRQIQEAKQLRQERERTNQTTVSNDHLLQINDANMLSRLVAARLDLPISQHLLDQDYKLSVIKRVWEDQLQIKRDDFISDCDVLVACRILQKQIDHIQGNKDNIIIPSVRMKLIREGKSTSSKDSNTEAVQNQPAPPTEPISTEIIKEKSTTIETSSTAQSTSISNPCIICLQDEKRLACIPCGHFTACVPCSHALRTCPICRREIEAFVRIYI